AFQTSQVTNLCHRTFLLWRKCGHFYWGLTYSSLGCCGGLTTLLGFFSKVPCHREGASLFSKTCARKRERPAIPGNETRVESISPACEPRRDGKHAATRRTSPLRPRPRLLPHRPGAPRQHRRRRRHPPLEPRDGRTPNFL